MSKIAISKLLYEIEKTEQKMLREGQWKPVLPKAGGPSFKTTIQKVSIGPVYLGPSIPLTRANLYKL